MSDLTLWSDLPSEGGKLVAYIGPPYLVLGGRWRRRLTNDHEMTFGVVWTAPYVGELYRGRVLRLATRGEVWWWTILHVGDEMETPVKQVYAVGIEDRLRAMGPLAISAPGQRPYYSAGYIDLVPHQMLDTFVLPHLHNAGWSGVARGEIDSLRLHEQAWSQRSAREIVDEMGVKVGCETRLRYDPDSGNHRIDVLDEIGADAPPVYVARGRNLRSLAVTRGQGDFATALVPLGDGSDGTGERHGISEASWFVSAKSGDVLTLAARGGGAGPIAFDDQWNGYFLLSRAATFHEIEDSDASTGQVTLESGGGSAFAVGDDVVIYADDQGTPITELANPAAVAAYGRECLTKSYEGYRSERQHVLNPFFARWPNKPDVVLGAVDGAVSQTSSPVSMSLDGLPVGRVLAVGDILATQGTARGWRVTVGGTVNGSGEVTVTVHANNFAGGTANNTAVYHFRQTGFLPERWENSGVIVMARPSEGLDVTGACESTANSHIQTIKGLTEGDVIAPGDRFDGGTTVTDGVVLIGGVADASGEVTVMLDRSFEMEEDEPIGLWRPAIGTDGMVPVVIAPGQGFGPSALDNTNNYLVSDSWTFRYRAGMGPVYFTAVLMAYVVTTTGSISAWPVLEVRETDGTLIDSVSHPGGTNEPLALSVGIELEEDTELEVRVRMATLGGGDTAATVPIRCYAFEAPDEMTPPVDGSHGTELFQRGLTDLKRISTLPATYRTRVTDLSEMDGHAAEWERATLGGRIMLRDAEMKVADSPRVVELDGSLDDPRDVQFLLGTRPDLASRQAARSRPLPQFIVYTPPDADGESVQTGAPGMPTKIEQAPRAVGAPGSAPTVVPVFPDFVPHNHFSMLRWLTGITFEPLFPE